ncbi:MAG: phosphate oxidase-related protein [Monoraphidium minutum]|nr:MAG: phosphate oxidase-related protein [Monoraphidium minutum]
MSAPTTAAAPQWRQMLQRSLGKNRSLAYSRYVQLATVREDGRPANRTVVFRGFLDGAADAVTFVTDRRSDKVGQAAANPAAEVAWYLPNTREQYRISGRLDIVQEGRGGAAGGGGGGGDAALAAARRKAWSNMSDAGRLQFLWPHPGLPRIPDKEDLFLQPAPDSAGEPAADFCLVVLYVDEVRPWCCERARLAGGTERRAGAPPRGGGARCRWIT